MTGVQTCALPISEHEFWIGSCLVHWRWANDKWSHLTDRDNEITHWIRIGTCRNMQGQKLYQVVVGKFMVMWGFA